MSAGVRLELVVLRWLVDAPCGLSLGELRVRFGKAAPLLDAALERLAGQVACNPGLVFSATDFGRERLSRDSAFVL